MGKKRSIIHDDNTIFHKEYGDGTALTVNASKRPQYENCLYLYWRNRAINEGGALWVPINNLEDILKTAKEKLLP